MDMAFKAGPTGPNGTWQEGDLLPVGFGAATKISAEQADDLNKQVTAMKEKSAAAEMTRQNFTLMRICPKCKFEPEIANESPTIHYRGDEDDCQMEHGKSEHLDRQCQVCHYRWAENLPNENWKDDRNTVHLHLLNNH